MSTSKAVNDCPRTQELMALQVQDTVPCMRIRTACADKCHDMGIEAQSRIDKATVCAHVQARQGTQEHKHLTCQRLYRLDAFRSEHLPGVLAHCKGCKEHIVYTPLLMLYARA